MRVNKWRLNPDKTEVLLVGPDLFLGGRCEKSGWNWSPLE